MKKLFSALLTSALLLGGAMLAQAETLQIYGPGGPLPAFRELAAAFEKEKSVTVNVTAGPTGKWLDQARRDADLIFSGSETMMSDFVVALDGLIQSEDVHPLYLRPLSMLVRPGNPKDIKSFKDITQAGVKIVVVNGAGQNGVWEDAAGRTGDIELVKAVRRNIVFFAKNSAEAKQYWTEKTDADVWLIWNIWQVANPKLAQAVPVDEAHVIYRDTGIAVTTHGKKKQAAQDFLNFAAGPRGKEIFAKWGWKTDK